MNGRKSMRIKVEGTAVTGNPAEPGSTLIVIFNVQNYFNL
jgi:hypothetical protein